MLGSDELIKNRRHITQTLRYYPSTVFKYLSPAGSLSRGDFFPVLRDLDTGTQANTTVGWLGFYAIKKLIVLC